MSKQKLLIGIIGSGYITDFHIPVIKNNKKVEIVAIYSKTFKNVKKKAKQYNIKFFTNDFNEFINKFNYDGILVAVSADQIFRTLSKLLKYQIPLLIEKPVALSYLELIKLIKINNKYKTPNLIGLNRRYYSLFKKIMKDLKNKNKLKSFLIEGHENIWKIEKIIKSEEILKKWHYANNIHIVDLINFFVNSKLQTIKYFNSKLKKYNNINSILKFENGVTGSYISNWNTPSRYSIKLFTDQKTYIIKPLENCIVINKNFKENTISSNKMDIKYKPGFFLQFQNFIKLIKTKKNSWPDTNLESVLDTYKIINKIY